MTLSIVFIILSVSLLLLNNLVQQDFSVHKLINNEPEIKT